MPQAMWSLLKKLDEYPAQATQAAFLLGGIGTGNVSLGARGEFKDWEVFNTPGKGNHFPYTFFALHVNNGLAGGANAAQTRVLEGPMQPPHNRSHGYDSAQLAGLPRLSHSYLRAEYPLCAVRFEDDALPVSVCLEAYTPFIPLDAQDSALPLAVVRYRVHNRSGQPCFAAVAGSMANMSSFEGYGTFNYVQYASDTLNRPVDQDGLRGILFEALPDAEGRHIPNSFSLTTPHAQLTLKPEWYHGAWYDGAQDFWDDFCSDGLLAASASAKQTNQILFQSRQRIGSVAPYQLLQAGEETVFTFYLTWHIPWRRLSWWQNKPAAPKEECTRNYYSLRFQNALDVAAYAHHHIQRLEEATFAFHRCLFDSTLPKPVLDAVSANITVLRSPTCFRTGDGAFFGWEGCFAREGCCDGSCTHVWNYAQTLAHLFPALEQSMRRNEFLAETDAQGAMRFRARVALRDEAWAMPPAIDGQCGSIVRLCREWRISGDDALVEQLGPNALQALDFAIRHWDQDGDGLPDGAQHNTYDIEFYGPNPLSAGVLLAALKAGAAIAARLGQSRRASAYQRLFEQASAKADALMWQDGYYVQRLADVDAHPYQHGLGCLGDQLLGQFLAHSAGLGYVLPQAHVRQALLNIYRHNYQSNLCAHHSVQRCFALAGEAGLLLCTWPQGGRPKFPFPYSNEVWTGVEYQLAASLIYEGLVEEGLELVRAARSRHDGYKRNPFDEVECGHHYARSMASWALIPALSGLQVGSQAQPLRIQPRLNPEDFRCFYSTGREWGSCRQWRAQDGTLQQAFEPAYRA